jgi:hypothetical protein
MSRAGIAQGKPVPWRQTEQRRIQIPDKRHWILDYYNPMADRSIFEQISQGIADAVTDIPEKVVGEPWWGRALTERQSTEWPCNGHRRSNGLVATCTAWSTNPSVTRPTVTLIASGITARSSEKG